MASQRITRADLYPDGTTVTAYPAANWSMAARPPSGAPVGSSAGTAGVMASGAAVLTGLADATDYVAYGLVSGEHRYVGFKTSAAAPWRLVAERIAQIAAAVGSGQRYMIGDHQSIPVVAGTTAGAAVLSFDAGSHAEEGKSTKLRMVLSLLVNDAAPVSDFTVALFPVATSVGGVSVQGITAGPVVAASSLTVVAPAANSRLRMETADFDPIATGLYVIGVNNSAATAASSMTGLVSRLEVRNVKG